MLGAIADLVSHPYHSYMKMQFKHFILSLGRKSGKGLLMHGNSCVNSLPTLTNLGRLCNVGRNMGHPQVLAVTKTVKSILQPKTHGFRIPIIFPILYQCEVKYTFSSHFSVW